MSRLHEAQVSHRFGPHDDVFEARLLRVGLDAGEALVKPDAQIAHQHDMVAGVHSGVSSVAVPKFPDRGRAFVDHVAPARVVLLRGYRVCQVRPPPCGEHSHEPLAPNETRADMAVGLMGDLANKMVEYRSEEH